MTSGDRNSSQGLLRSPKL